MLSIDYSPQARRALAALPAATRRLISQLVQAVAEIAELFPDQPGVWRRLGRVRDRRVEIDIERRGVCVEVADQAVRVLRISEGRTGARQVRPATAQRSGRKTAAGARSRAAL